MKVAILRSAKAYLPEVDAYRDFLRARGIDARATEQPEDITHDELAILFRGRDHVSRAIRARRRIHEEHNHPTRSKRLLRRAALSLGPSPDGMVLLDHLLSPAQVRHEATLVRETGFDAALLETRPAARPDFDLVYCGTLERPGLAEGFDMLARRGFRLAVYGEVPDRFPRHSLERGGLTFFGRIGRQDVGAALANARAGLNLTPDLAPVRYQDSMKTLEYLAVGLPVVANRYRWMEAFADRHALQVGWLDTMLTPDLLDTLPEPTVDLSGRTWEAMLDRLDFDGFLKRVWQ